MLLSSLVHCKHCSRHFKRVEVACPFCGAVAADAGDVAVRSPSGASRSRVYAASAGLLVSAVFVACTEGSSSPAAATGDASSTGAGATTDETAGQSTAGNPDETTTATPSVADTSGAETRNAATLGDATSEVVGSSGSDVLGGGEACPGFTVRTEGGARCDEQAPCAEGLVCSNGPVYIADRGGVPNCVADPCQCNPDIRCDATNCDGQCVDNGTSCGTCVPNCSPDNCSDTFECVDNRCVAKPCDAEGGTVCGDGQRCEPSSVANGSTGCVFILCDQPEALECGETHRCDPEDAAANPMGCVQKKCDEEGGPACQEYTACRPGDAEANIFGCAPLRCDEAGGPACGEGYDCAPEADNAIGAGCAPTSCDAGWSCAPWKKCDPSSSDGSADIHGCADQSCTEDSDCECGFCVNSACSPEPYTCWVPEIVATPYGCVWPDDEWV